MNTLENLRKELESVENEISTKEITEEMYSLFSLLNKRVFLGKKIAQYNWDKLDWSEKEKKRELDFNITKAYFEKFQDEVANKYNYKREYIDFYREAKKLSLVESSQKNLHTIILKILNSKEYVNISEQVCLFSIIEHMKLEATPELVNLLEIYNRLSYMSFELKQ